MNNRHLDHNIREFFFLSLVRSNVCFHHAYEDTYDDFSLSITQGQTSAILHHTVTRHNLKTNSTLFSLMSVCTVNLRSSSKYVSLPSAPGTEQIRRVLRNVVHLFTRLR